jgi:spore coat polysaccharide biosynthesis protein SpsF (cytidylyltransferase family)
MEMYVGSVVEILQKQDADYVQGRSPIAGIPCEQLRDYLLAKIKSKARRDKLWKDVERQVLELSSVTTCAVLIRGEQFDALQYVGIVRKED